MNLNVEDCNMYAGMVNIFSMYLKHNDIQDLNHLRIISGLEF